MAILRIVPNQDWNLPAKISDEDYNQLRIIFKDLPVKKSEYRLEASDVFIDSEDLSFIPEHLEPYIFLKTIKLLKNTPEINDLNKIKPRDVRDLLQTVQQIHLPSNELLNITRVMLEEDCCTDTLQERLEEGYRIIAVLPQATQRRPDYILGKVIL